MTHKQFINQFILPFWVSLALAVGSCTHEDNSETHGEHNETHEEHSEVNEEHSEDTHLSHEAGHQEEGNGHEHGQEALHKIRADLEHDQVLITGEQFKNADIKLGKIEQQSLSETIKVFGKVALAPRDEAHVSSVVEGVVQDIRKIEGDRVEKNETLALLKHPEVVQIQQDYLNAVNRFNYLKLEFERQQRLFSDSVSSAKSFERTRSEYLNSKVAVHSLARKLKLMNIAPEKLTPENISSFIPIKSPLAGYVTRVNVKTGAYVETRQELFQVTANENVHLDLQVYEKDISKVEQGQSLTFNMTNNPAPAPLKGYVIRKARNFDAESRTALVHAGINGNKQNLYPGMSVKSFIQTGGKKEPSLPEQSFVEENGETYIFVLSETGSIHPEHPGEKFYIFTHTPVNKGANLGGFAAVQFYREIEESARVVISNPQALLAEMKKGSAGHGHAH